MAWSRENRHICLRDLLFDLTGKRHKGRLLYSFCHIHNDLAFSHKRRHLLCRASRKRRRNCKHKEIFSFYRRFQISCDHHVVRKFHARQLQLMFPLFIEHLYFIFINRPDSSLMSVVRKKNRQCGSPASCPKYAYICHNFATPSLIVYSC